MALLNGVNGHRPLRRKYELTNGDRAATSTLIIISYHAPAPPRACSSRRQENKMDRIKQEEARFRCEGVTVSTPIYRKFTSTGVTAVGRSHSLSLITL